MMVNYLYDIQNLESLKQSFDDTGIIICGNDVEYILNGKSAERDF